MDELAIQFARRARDADIAIFYFSGHAMQLADINFLMPIDAKLTDEADLRRATRVDDIVADLQPAKNLKVLGLDACRDNPLAEGLRRSFGVTRTANLQHGLARIDSPPGMIVAYATQAGRIQDQEEIGIIFRRISSDVYEATNHAQIPELSLSLIGEFYLHGRPPAGNASAAESRAARSDTCAGAEAHWKSAETLGSKATLEDHLSRFASCAFVGLAKAKLAALTSQNASTTGVDPAGVGTWETMVPNGLARWIWEIRPDGTYRFHSEGPGSPTTHEGTMTLGGGHWTLLSNRGLAGWQDGGPYELRDANTLVATGRLGIGIWRRIGIPRGEGGPHRATSGPSRSQR
jgi:hypothetical protein